MKKLLPIAIMALVSPQLHASAADYNGKAMALSGAGVAFANYTYGVQLNPANAVRFNNDDDFNLNLNAGAEVSDPDELIDEGEELADRLTALGTVNPSTSTRELEQLRDSLIKLDAATARVSGAGNLSIAIPNQHAAAVFYVNYVATVEATTINTAQDAQLIQDLLDGTRTTPIDVDNDLDSTVVATGVLMREIALSLGREFDIDGQPVAFGITPKHQKVETIVYSEKVANFDSDDFDADRYTLEDSNFNLDFGVSTHWDAWYLGVSLTNLIAKTYDTVNPSVQAKLDTKATVGASYKSGWGLLSIDADLNPTQYFGTAHDAQFVRVGAELDLWDTLQLRVGYRHDLENNLNNTASAGIGFSPFGVVNIDLAVLAGENDTLGGAIQLGVSF